MEFDPLTIFAVGGVASLIIERFFYYKSRYKSKKNNNPNYGERIVALETDMKNVKEDIREIKEELGKA